MSECTLTIHFHDAFPEKTRNTVIEYIKSFPIGFWNKHINVHKDKQTDLIRIGDNKRQYEVFEHECREVYA